MFSCKVYIKLRGDLSLSVVAQQGSLRQLTLAQAGLEPVLLERGGDVAGATKDVEDFRMSGVLNVHPMCSLAKVVLEHFPMANLTLG